jgi:pyridoxal phosphate enzyme (YggS family)
MTTTMTLKDRYRQVKDRVADAAARSGQDPARVILVAVTKFAGADQIRDLITLGHVDFGENKVQQLVQRAAIIDEWLARHRTMPSTGWPAAIHEDDDAGDAWKRAAADQQPPPIPGAVRWHMIGHLQRNKVRKAAEICRLIHSIDSLRLAEEVQLVAEKRDKVIDVLLQVNIAGEGQKFGCSVPAAMHLAEQIDTMIQVRVRGLMVMAPLSDNPEEARPIFARARELFEEIRTEGIGGRHFNILSMGMSGDYEIAIEEGANVVRVGSAIFGEPRELEIQDEED